MYLVLFMYVVMIFTQALITTLPYHKVVIRMGCFGGESPNLASSWVSVYSCDEAIVASM